MQNYKRLRVTQRTRKVIRATYLFTKGLPREEVFGLTSQMRRAAVSVGLNIAEGCSRRGSRELIRFLEFSLGSVMELDFAVVICGDLDYATQAARENLEALITITRREFLGLISSGRARPASGTLK